MSDRRWALEPMSPTRPMGPQSLRPMRSRKIRFQGCLPPSPGWFGMVIGSLTSRSNAGAVRSSHWSAATRCPVSDRPALGAAGIATVNRHGSHNPEPTAGRPGQVPPGSLCILKRAQEDPEPSASTTGADSTSLPPSLPLDRSGRFAGEVQHHSVDTADLIGDAGADAFEEFVGNLHPVGGHAVL